MRRRQTKSLLSHALTVMLLPVVLTSVGYAVFSQTLSVTGDTAKPAYSYSQSLLMTYTKTTAPQSGSTLYTQNVTIRNNGSNGVTSWQVKFDVPAGTTNLSCSAAVTCSLVGTTVTINSTATNGTINPASTATFVVSFLTSPTNYTLQNVIVSGVPAPIYRTITGLTVTQTAGKRTKVGAVFQRPYTFTVTNSSGQAVTSWRITANWSSTTNSIVSMPTTVNYTTSATQIVITSKTSVANGSNFQFVGTLGSTTANWVLSGITIQGAP